MSREIEALALARQRDGLLTKRRLMTELQLPCTSARRLLRTLGEQGLLEVFGWADLNWKQRAGIAEEHTAALRGRPQPEASVVWGLTVKGAKAARRARVAA